MILVTTAGQQYTLQPGDNTVGRGSDCDLCLASEQVSRHHAVIRWDGYQATILDLGSTNGTHLNGRRLDPHQPTPLSVGDRLELGGVEGRLTVGLTSEPLPLIPPNIVSVESEPPHHNRRLWLAVAGVGAAIVLILLAAVALVIRNRDTESAKSPASTSVGASAVLVQTPTVLAAAPTLTMALPPAAKIAPEVGGAIGTPPVLKPLAPGQLPPINPTSMPELIASLVEGAAPAGVLPTLATALPGLPTGKTLPGLSGGTPALPAVGARRYPAATLRAPANGASYQGDNATIMLEWETIQNLGQNDYYRVIIYYKKDGRELAGGTWMKGTSYRVPVWFLAQQSGRFEWQVVIVEATGLPENGGKLGAAVSEASARRWFSWNWEAPNEPTGPTATPKFEG